jgi:hypothetical protein
VGGIQSVILGDDEARVRGTQKTVQERKAPPTFDVIVEIVTHDEIIVHPDCAKAVDLVLQGQEPGGLRRTPGQETPLQTPDSSSMPPRPAQSVPTDRLARIFPYALNPDLVERVIRDLRIKARVVHRPEHADIILALRAREEDQRLGRMLRATGASLHAVKKSSTAQIRNALRNVFHVLHGIDEAEVGAAVRDAEDAVRRVIDEGSVVALPPRSATLRKLQHRIAARHDLEARSEGRESARHLVIGPSGN